MRKEPEIDGRLCHLLDREGLVSKELIGGHVGVFERGIVAHRLAVLHLRVLFLVQRQNGREERLECLEVFVHLLADLLVGHDLVLASKPATSIANLDQDRRPLFTGYINSA